MTAMSVRGYCRTLSERMDCRPANQDDQADDDGKDGRLMNRSVSFI